MTLKLKNILLAIGLSATILSFIFFSIDTNIYGIILLSGILVSSVSYFAILIDKRTIKSKLIWTGIVILAVGVHWVTETPLITLSNLILIKKHETALTHVNKLLLTKKRNVVWVYDAKLWNRNGLSEKEGNEITKFIEKMNVSFIEKDSNRIYYQTFSRYDVSHGLLYYYKNNPESRYHHITGNWYW